MTQDIDQLTRNLISWVIESCTSVAEVDYWITGITQRLNDVNWAEELQKKKVLQRAWAEARKMREEEYCNELVQCTECNRMVHRGDCKRLDQIPKSRYMFSLFCLDCAERLLEEYNARQNQTFENICQACGLIYESKHYDNDFRLCASCNSPFTGKELKRIRNQLRRAHNAGLEATLTLSQWLKTIDDFSGLCAYCQLQPFTQMEHFVPLSAGGGTTVGNCIPVCAECNSRKSRRHPYETPLPFRELHVARVQAYLHHLSIQDDLE